MKISLTIYLIFLLSLSSKSQVKESSDSLIYWTQIQMLKWSDFQGEKDTIDSRYTYMEAVSAISIFTTGYYENDILKYRVTNYFNKSKSWATDTTVMSLLEHENIHFDIAELYTRKIRQGIEILIDKNKTSEEDYIELIEKLLNEFSESTKRFDKETAHGLVLQRQQKWKEKVEEEINSLEKYYIKRQ